MEIKVETAFGPSTVGSPPGTDETGEKGCYMQIMLFARKRTTKEGKPFATFITTLTRKDGSQLAAQVKFKEDCGQPKPEKCPMNIIFEKTDGNLAKRTYTDSMGDEKEAFTLWISAWKEGEPYVDKSLDDFE